MTKQWQRGGPFLHYHKLLQKEKPEPTLEHLTTLHAFFAHQGLLEKMSAVSDVSD